MNYNILKHKYLFIGGLTSSGTTVVYNCINKTLLNSKTTKPYREGQFDPNHPDFLGKNYELQSKFHKVQKQQIIEWISKYNIQNSDIFIEKSPRHFACFLGLQDLFQNSFFICLQRNPYQCLASALERWNSKIELIEKRLISMIQFHNIYRKKLVNFSYIKYEQFCNRPIDAIRRALSTIQLNNYYIEDLEKTCKILNVKPPEIHQKPKFNKRINKLCDKLCDKWGYNV